jgi:hypothetical protein
MASYGKGRSILHMVMIRDGGGVLWSWSKVASTGIEVWQHLIRVIFPLSVYVPLACYAHLCGMSTLLLVQAFEGPVEVVI